MRRARSHAMLMKRPAALHSWLAGLLAVNVVGCGATAASSGGDAFSYHWRPDEGLPLPEIYARIRDLPVHEAPQVAVGIAKQQVLGRALGGAGSNWQVPLDAIAEPAVAGDVAVITTASELVALHAATGQRLWTFSHEGRSLFGIDDDGENTALTLGPGEDTGGTVLVIRRGGGQALQLDSDEALGTPAVRGPYVFVPWGNQFISIFAIGSEDEVGRLVLRSQISHALSQNGELFFGEQGLLRFDEQLARTGEAKNRWVQPPAQELPGEPLWFERNLSVFPIPGGAKLSVRLLARPTADGIDGATYAATYFRLAYGLDAAESKPRWVLTTRRAILGGAAVAGGFVFCTSDGKLTSVEGREGGVSDLGSFGTPLSACAVSAETLRIAPGSGSRTPLHEQFHHALLLSDPQMATAQAFLLEHAALRPEPALTKTIIDVILDPRATPSLADRASVLLAGRRVGEDFMIQALQRRYDFLQGILRGPPVAPLAEALAALEDPRAAPLLVEHLNDPTHPAKSVLRVAQALGKLAGPDQAPGLRSFFALYRATADSELMADAVVTVAETLLRIGDRESKLAVQRAAEDEMTPPAIRERLLAMFKA